VKVGFVVFEAMTALDFVGAYDALTRLHSMKIRDDFDWEICARTELVTDDRGLRIAATDVDQPLDDFDLIVVAGGFGTRPLQHDSLFIDWLRTASRVPIKASVCSGALLLGAAGFLEGLRATTHASSFDELAKYCREVVDERIVDEGAIITAGGVSSSIDLGLYLVEKIDGRDAAEKITRQMEYRPPAILDSRRP